MASDKTTTLATAHYGTVFDPEVEDVPVILPGHRGGTEVPQGKVKDVEKAAEEAGVQLRKL